MAGKTTNSKQKRLLSLYRMAIAHAEADQIKQTSIPFLKVIHSSKPTVLGRGVVKPSLCIILSGGKEIHIGTHIHKYGPGDYLVATIDMPATGRISKASSAAPYLGVSLELDPKEITSILLEAEIPAPTSKKMGPAAFVSISDSEIQGAFYRLLKLLEKKQNSAFLAKTIKKELLYHLLTGEHAELFFQHAVVQHQEVGIDKAISWLKKNFDQPLDVETLAKFANMSVSSLHHKFKDVTTMGPLQYQKRLRLQEARQLLMSGTANVSETALQVGYQSHSQFTREYRRLFGVPPLQDVSRLKQLPEHLQE